MSARLTAWMLSFILLLGLVLRCDHLQDRTVWFDEAFSYTLVENFSPFEIVTRTARDVHPPLYYLMLWGWTQCWGTSPVALRSLSVVFGLGTIGFAFLVARDAACRLRGNSTGPERSRAAGLAAAMLVATSAAQVRWSWEARMYTQATLLLLVSSWCALQALDSTSPARRGWWIGFSCSTAALLYTHNYGLFSFVGICVWLGLELCRVEHDWCWPWKHPQWRSISFSVGAVVWAYLPWFPVLLDQKSQVQGDYWIPPIDWWTLPRAWFSLFIPSNGDFYLSEAAATWFGILMVSLAVILLVRGKRLDRLSLAMWLTPVLIAVAISLISVPVIVDRHFLLSQLGVLLGLGGLVASIKPGLPYWSLLALLAVDGVAVVKTYRDELNVAERPGIRGAIEYALAHRKEDEPILVLHPCIYFSSRYYARGRAPVHMYVSPDQVTHYTGGPIVQDRDFFPLDELDSVAGEKLWVLDTDGFSPGRTSAMIPIGWRMRESEVFRDVYQFQGSISVTKYERRAKTDQSHAQPSASGNQVNANLSGGGE